MSSTILTFDSGEIAIAVNVAKGIIGVSGAYGGPNAWIRKIGISAKGTVANGQPVLCRFCGTPAILSGGTGVTYSARGLQMKAKTSGNLTDTAPTWTTGRHSFTLPTTNVNIYRSFEVHPNGGWYVEEFKKDEGFQLIQDQFSYWFDAKGDTALSLTGFIDVEE